MGIFTEVEPRGIEEERKEIPCGECWFWDSDNLKCKHPENPEPNDTTKADNGCEFGEFK